LPFEALVRRGTLMTVIVGVINVLGMVAALRIPVQMTPDLEVRTITIRTTWLGAIPEGIEIHWITRTAARSEYLEVKLGKHPKGAMKP
jgi:multidrug efflux pump subunit AcrB